MTRRLFSLFIRISVLLILTSCGSMKFEGNAVLAGRVYDSDGKPVKNYHILLGNGMEAVTDDGGIFSFQNVPSGTYKIRGGGNGWCSCEQTFKFYDRKEILCIQVERLEKLLPKIEEMIFDGDLEGADFLLSKSKEYNENNPVFTSCKNLIAYCRSPSEKRKSAFYESLEKIKNYRSSL